jgi:hypothetical protein
MADADSIAIPPRVKDLTGQKFGRWSVLAFSRREARITYWLCRCDCGSTKTVSRTGLVSGDSQSCGCFHREQASAARTTHGGAGTTENNIWNGIKARCYNRKNPAWYRYGGRGITVCDRWFNSFEAFFEDMGPRPSSKHSIERIDNNGNYDPRNCKWATRKEQNRNTRQNVLLTFSGKTQCIAAWSDEFGITWNTLWQRLKRGWSVERALTEQVRYSRTTDSSAIPSL